MSPSVIHGKAVRWVFVFYVVSVLDKYSTEFSNYLTYLSPHLITAYTYLLFYIETFTDSFNWRTNLKVMLNNLSNTTLAPTKTPKTVSAKHISVC